MRSITARIIFTLFLIGVAGPRLEAAAATGPVDESTPARPVVHPLTDSSAAPLPSGITVIGASPEQQEQLDTAVTLFETAGLPLPALEVQFNDDSGPCSGYAGLFIPARSAFEPDTIQICHRLHVILVHELAHAWEHHALDDDGRAHFVDHFGLETWSDPDHEWEDRGIEMAAHTVAYTLTQRAETDNPDIVRFGCSYEVLTGRSLPNPDVFDCGEAGV